MFLDCENNDQLRQWITMIERVAVGPVNPPPTVHIYWRYTVTMIRSEERRDGTQLPSR